jgi:ATP-dependent Clp protease adaptor protein ClpS
MIDTSYQEDEDIAVLSSNDNARQLILYNDDLISFDHVITCLIKYCKHSAIQAEQCAVIVHTKGKTCIKEGQEDFLNNIKINLDGEGLTTEIQ